jgi:hypothetical protein
MDDSELAIYRQCTGRTDPPNTEPSEAYTIVGRRGGKSFISALTGVFVACFGTSSENQQSIYRSAGAAGYLCFLRVPAEAARPFRMKKQVPATVRLSIGENPTR